MPGNDDKPHKLSEKNDEIINNNNKNNNNKINPHHQQPIIDNCELLLDSE